MHVVSRVDRHLPQVIDFGLSNTCDGGKLLKTACGSPCYASPEMIAGHKYVGSLSDMWSMGVILFAMVCGYLPFEHESTSKLYQKILNGEYTAPDFISSQVTLRSFAAAGLWGHLPTCLLTFPADPPAAVGSFAGERSNSSHSRNKSPEAVHHGGRATASVVPTGDERPSAHVVPAHLHRRSVPRSPAASHRAGS